MSPTERSHPPDAINNPTLDVSQINKRDRKSGSGTAAALAMGGIPQAFTQGHALVGVGVGSWNGQSGVADRCCSATTTRR